MSLTNPALARVSGAKKSGHMENPLLTSSLLRPSVGTTKSYAGTSSLLAKSSLSSSLFGTSLSTKRRPVSRPGGDREDEARVAKLKKEADQLRLGLSKEKTNMSLRSSLLLTSSSHGVPLGGSTHGGLLGGTGSQRLTNPLLTNPLLSTTSGLLSTGPKLTQTVTSTSKVKATKRKVMVAKEAPKVKLPRPATAPAKAKQAKASRNQNTKMASRTRKVERLEAEPSVPTVSEMPEYDLDLGELVGDVGFDLETFLSMAEDPDLEITRPLVDIQSVKRALINGVAGSLIRAPDFKVKHDPVRQDLIDMANMTARYEPEFVLKVALYTRNELNIRSTANFLLAFASFTATCRPYLRRYFSTAIRLPSDWIDVAEQYQVFDDKSIKFGSLPSALRRAMIAKFPDFDKYQLGKYNKDSSSKKKKKKANEESGRGGRGGRGGFRGRGGRGRGGRGGRGGRDDRERRNDREARDDREGFVSQEGYHGDFPSLMRHIDSSSSSSEDEDEDNTITNRQVSRTDESESEEEIVRKTFTLKQLIRKLHVTEPVEHVMCLIGKKYPTTLDDFYASRLPGTFEEERSGKRMKLPTPETWETQVSLKGNKASTWQDLIDHNKLPFMAMLRNLRNMIKAGISEKHHTWVLRKLTDERAVANSRQFPFRFFSAYEVLSTLEKEYNENQQEIIDAAVAGTTSAPSRPARGRGGRGRGRGRGGRGGRGGKGADSSLPQETKYDAQMLQRYRKALDTSVKIATVHNVTPIAGTTVILVNVGVQMNRPCSSARGLGKPRTLSEVGILLGLMCKYSCEECRMIIYGGFTDTPSQTVDLEKGTILDNMDSVKSLQEVMNAGVVEGVESPIPTSHLTELLRDRIQVDNLIVLSDGLDDEYQSDIMSSFLDKYRRLVNPDLLFVNVDLGGRMPSVTKREGHENDVHIAGFSDQILRFVAERGSAGQLVHVEKIDEAYNLKPMPGLAPDRPAAKINAPNPERPLPVPALKPRWRTARVFISSTFRDMHGERDLLTRFVFPELRARAEKHLINVYEVDLRWGVTESQTRNNKAVQLCLAEVARSDLFVGMLGERYGWVPDHFTAPDEPGYEWLDYYPKGTSVTELEIYLAALCNPSMHQDNAFFYFRDNSFEKDLPKKWRDDFVSEDSVSHRKMEELKSQIRSSGLEVMENYPCHWGGVVNKVQPFVAGLDDFRQRVLNNLWGGLLKAFPDEAAVLDEDTHLTALHDAFMASRQHRFVGRAKLLRKAMTTLKEMTSGMLLVAGKSGTGKTSVVSELVQRYVDSPHCASGLNVITHFLGAAPGSTNVVALLRRLCHEMKRSFGPNTSIPDEYKNLVLKFSELLSEVSAMATSKVVVVLEGLDLLEDVHQARNMEWLPNTLPPNCVLVLSVTEGTTVHQALTRRKPEVLAVGPLELLEKADVVRHTLSLHSKTLDESAFNNQMKLLTSKKEASIPLYLSLACDVLRGFGVFERFTEKIKSLPQTVPHLMQEVLGTLETDHGNDIVSTALSLIVLSRNGLDESSLHWLMSIHAEMSGTKSLDLHEVKMTAWDLRTRALLPAATFGHLLRSLQCFMRPTKQDSMSVLSVSNTEIRQAIIQRYLTATDTVSNLHRLLAGYYYSCADFDFDGSWRGTDTEAFSELPYHLVQGDCYEHLESILIDLRFLLAKCRLGLTAQTLQDFDIRNTTSKGTQKDQARFLESVDMKEFRSFMARNIHILKNHPESIIQQALNEPSHTVVELEGQRAVYELKRKYGVLQWLNKPQQEDACTLTLSGLPQVVTSVAFSPDNSRFVCGSRDGTAHVYCTATGRELLVLTGHSNKITSVTFAGDSRVCTASADNTLCLWDSKDGHRLSVMKGHKRPVSACVCDPRAKLIVSTGWDCQIKVWEAATGNLVSGYIKAESCPAGCVAFHPEDDVVATGWWDSAIRLYNVFHKKRLGILRGHSTSVRDVAFSPSGRHIASASLDGEVKLWSSQQGTLVGNLHCHSLPINQLTFAPSGHELITVSDDRQIKVWSGHLGQPVSHLTPNGDHGPVSAVTFCNGSEQLAAGYHQGHVRVFDTGSGTLDFEVHPHTKRVRCVATLDNYVISGSDDATTAVISLSSGKVVCRLAGHTKAVLSIAICPFAIATTSDDFTVCLYPVAGASFEMNKSLDPSQIFTGHVGPVTGCTFNPEGTKLATCSRDKSVRIWDLSAPKKAPVVLDECHSDWINGIAWSGKFLVTASNDFNLKLWDAASYQEKVKFVGHTAAVTGVAYQNGCVVSTCTDGTVKVWSHRGTEITTLHGHSQCVNAADIYVKIKKKPELSTGSTSWADMTEEEDWSAKHSAAKLSKTDIKLEDLLVASCSEDGSVRTWRPLEGNELACLTGHADRVVAVACAKDGTILSASRDKTIKLWKPTLKESVQKSGHMAEVTSLAFLPDRTMFLSASRDGTVKLWELDSYSCVPMQKCTLVAHEKAVTSVCVTESKENETRFITGSDDGSVKAWKILKKNSGVSIKFMRTVCSDLDPVTSVTWTIKGSKSYVLVTSWDGVRVCELGAAVVKRYYQQHKDYVLSSCLTSDKLLTTSADGHVIFMGIDEQAKGPLSLTHLGKVLLPTPGPEQSNWVTTVTAARDTAWVGDTHGLLVCLKMNDCTIDYEKTQKAHKGTLRSVAAVGPRLLTSGEDGTLKVWNASNATQAGQFFMTSPVTCVAGESYHGNELVIGGDALGNVIALKYLQ